ncbi:hypothetical protein FJTKL_03021 [Diaporthe vaccinii]|uniref:Uncharacterized protein n=1 Tax=Diaporthe vaccinii TaxID=105482 RepID=A0ABR4DWK1_9PEZI
MWIQLTSRTDRQTDTPGRHCITAATERGCLSGISAWARTRALLLPQYPAAPGKAEQRLTPGDTSPYSTKPSSGQPGVTDWLAGRRASYKHSSHLTVRCSSDSSSTLQPFASTRTLTSTFPCFLLQRLLPPPWDLHYSHSSLHLSALTHSSSYSVILSRLSVGCLSIYLAFLLPARLGLLSVISLMIPPHPGSLLFGEPTLPGQTIPAPPPPHRWLPQTPTSRHHLR